MQKPLYVAFSDPHLGRSWTAHTVPSTREALTTHYEYPIHEAIQKYADHNVPLVCGGDWFDRAHNSERMIQRSNEMLQRMERVVAGNHDHVGRDSALTSLQLLHELQGEQSPIGIAPDHLNAPAVDLCSAGGVLIYSVPHHATQALFEQAVFEAEAHARGQAGHKVIFLHCNYGAPGGGKPDTNLYLTAPLQKALEEVFDFILLGHEHLPRRIGSKVVIMGSTQPCSFGELGPRFFYEFHEEGGKLVIKPVAIATQLKHREVTLELVDGQIPEVQAEQLVDLQGNLPVRYSAAVQKLVKKLYADGALAVRMGVTFDAGTTLDGDAVSGSMKNLIDVVRYEVSEHPTWPALLEASLKRINEEKV